MKIISILFACLPVALVTAQLLQTDQGCPPVPCALVSCPAPQDCQFGSFVPTCECCPICMKGENEECSFDDECIFDLECKKGTCQRDRSCPPDCSAVSCLIPDNCRFGTVVPDCECCPQCAKGPGESCRPSEKCQEGYFCTGGEEPYCVSDICKLTLCVFRPDFCPLGRYGCCGSCKKDLNERCSSEEECAAGLLCIGGRCVSDKCALVRCAPPPDDCPHGTFGCCGACKGGEDDECSSNEQCANELKCTDGQCTKPPSQVMKCPRNIFCPAVICPEITCENGLEPVTSPCGCCPVCQSGYHEKCGLSTAVCEPGLVCNVGCGIDNEGLCVKKGIIDMSDCQKPTNCPLVIPQKKCKKGYGPIPCTCGFSCLSVIGERCGPSISACAKGLECIMPNAKFAVGTCHRPRGNVCSCPPKLNCRCSVCPEVDCPFGSFIPRGQCCKKCKSKK